MTFELKTLEGNTFPVDADGSLGLLALGDVGLVIWREEKSKLRSLEKQKAHDGKIQ